MTNFLQYLISHLRPRRKRHKYVCDNSTALELNGYVIAFYLDQMWNLVCVHSTWKLLDVNQKGV